MIWSNGFELEFIINNQGNYNHLCDGYDGLIDEVKANFERLLFDMVDSLEAESAISAKMGKGFLDKKLFC